jgi:hypothetical protein
MAMVVAAPAATFFRPRIDDLLDQGTLISVTPQFDNFGMR